MTVDWSPLRAELSIWRREGRVLPIWWRDDDATSHTAHLDRLIAMGQTHGMPVHIAVIPETAKEALTPHLIPGPLRAIVHGWSHRNHAPEGQKRSEFGTPRDGALKDAAAGLTRMRTLFGDKAHPMFVPPWNRIDPDVVNGLPALGYRWISTFLPRTAKEAAPGLTQINTHIDPVDWRGTRGLADTDAVIAKLVAHLQDRRSGVVDAEEPLGLLTHHLVQDDPTWDFCDALLTELRVLPVAVFDIANEGAET